MIRLTLRQFRTEAAVGFGMLTLLAILVAVTGPHLAQVNEAFQRACKAARACSTAPNPVLQVDTSLQAFLPFVATITPALIGIFFGAPLIARELETGTFRLAWTQGVTKVRWFAVKLGLVGLAAIALSALLTWMVDWWMGPLNAANQNRFDPSNFSTHGVAPVGYAAFAFALGVTAGLLLRRTVPAIGATLLGFLAARLGVESWVRPNLAPPLHRSLSLLNTGHFGVLGVNASTGAMSLSAPVVPIANSWVLSHQVVSHSGQPLTAQSLLRTCPAYGQLPNGTPPSPAEMRSIHTTCIERLAAHFHTAVIYQPPDRFWPFQWAEFAIFLAAALALGGIAYWWLRRHYG